MKSWFSLEADGWRSTIFNIYTYGTYSQVKDYSIIIFGLRYDTDASYS